MSAVLTLAAFLALAARPECGAGLGVPASQLAATAQQESGFAPFVVAVNAKGRTVETRRFGTAAEATAFAIALDAQGRDYDAGLMQINRRQFARHGLTPVTVFDACRNLRAGAEHKADDYRAAIWHLANRRYNTGTFERGTAYARSVEIAERVIARSIPGPSAGAAAVPATHPVAAPPVPASPFVERQRGRDIIFRRSNQGLAPSWTR